MANNSTDFVFQDPSTLKPLFVAQYTVCAYPISDFWAAAPRYLYYVLLVLTVVVRWYGWLANVFLGVCAAYAGVAALEAFVILGAHRSPPPYQNVTVPYINSSATDATTLGLLHGNDTQDKVVNLVTGFSKVFVTPYVYEYDTDALFAILITGFLVMLPMHTWSSIVRRTRARRLLMMIWSTLMLGGSSCVVILWQKMLSAPYSFRFCYPGLLDANQTTADGPFDERLWQGDWNTTVWHTFSNLSASAGILSFACLNPCYRTKQVMRRSNTLISSTNVDSSYRTSITPTPSDDKVWTIAGFIFLFIYVTVGVALVLLLFSLTSLKKYTRVPISRPTELFGHHRRELLRAFWTDMREGVPWLCGSARGADSKSGDRLRRFARFWLDMVMMAVLIFSCIATPVMIVCFVVWIEWWIHRDISSDESLRQVGQWSNLASLGLVLVSAVVLELTNVLATTTEVDAEIEEIQDKLRDLQVLKQRKTRHEHISTGNALSGAGLELGTLRHKEMTSTDEVSQERAPWSTQQHHEQEVKYVPVTTTEEHEDGSRYP